jgi:hypothetical protein
LSDFREGRRVRAWCDECRAKLDVESCHQAELDAARDTARAQLRLDRIRARNAIREEQIRSARDRAHR